jgi:putative SOS response-associated peptidase YedK
MKQPFHIHRPEGGPFAFAGLWERWAPRTEASECGSSPAIESCTIVTTAANTKLSELHDRMPVILAPGDYALWLDPSVQDPARLAHLLESCGDNELEATPVSTHVNRVANDDPRCVEPERSLFS